MEKKEPILVVKDLKQHFKINRNFTVKAVALSNFPPISFPLKTIEPAVGLYKRIILLPVVDLPEPDSPTKP